MKRILHLVFDSYVSYRPYEITMTVMMSKDGDVSQLSSTASSCQFSTKEHHEARRSLSDMFASFTHRITFSRSTRLDMLRRYDNACVSIVLPDDKTLNVLKLKFPEFIRNIQHTERCMYVRIHRDKNEDPLHRFFSGISSTYYKQNRRDTGGNTP